MKKNQELKVKNWEFFFHDRGLSEDIIYQYIPYIKKLITSNLPVIFEIEHLSKLIGIDFYELNKMVASPHSFYREFSIPKRRGGRRIISSPYPSLLMCQRWIYENILKFLPVHFCAHAYRAKRSIISNANIHVNQNAVLKMDMKDFFPSIPINWVIKFFSDLGYANNVSYYLASICCLNDALPQGAATSPALSNILLTHLDGRIYKVSKTFGLNYTRYADDLAFSGKYIPAKYSDIIKKIIESYGLEVNGNKTALIVGDKQKIITGLSVQGESLGLPRASKRIIKMEVYYIKKYGVISHVSKLKIKNPYYLKTLEGKLRFWLQVEPRNSFVIESLSFILGLKD